VLLFLLKSELRLSFFSLSLNTYTDRYTKIIVYYSTYTDKDTRIIVYYSTFTDKDTRIIVYYSTFIDRILG